MQSKTVLQKQLQKQELKHLLGPTLALLFLFAMVVRFVAAVAYYNEYDTFWYRDWAWDTSNGLFTIYNRAESISLDYPPLYLFLLGITNLFYKIVGQDCNQYLQMFLMKFWPILSDGIFALILYRLLGCRYGQLIGVAAAFLWLLDPAAVFNSAFWGQTDGLLCMLLFLSYWQLLQNRPLWGSFCFAVAGLTKFQALFFLPLFLLLLWHKYGAMRFLKGICVAAGTVAAVFLPFSIGAKNPLLLFSVYLGGSGTYQYCTLNAFNLYGFLFKNFSKETEIVFLGLSYGQFSTILLVVMVALLGLLIYFSKRRCIFLYSFLWMNTLFIFTTRMHERYQFVSILFILVATLIHRRRRFLFCYAATSFTVLLNQMWSMLYWNNFSNLTHENYTLGVAVFSLINIVVYILTTTVCVSYVMQSEESLNVGQALPQTIESKQEEF